MYWQGLDPMGITWQHHRREYNIHHQIQKMTQMLRTSKVVSVHAFQNGVLFQWTNTNH